MLYVEDEIHLSYRAYFIGGILYMAEEKGKKMIGSYDIKVPEDTDVLLGYDVTANKVKNFKFSGIWTWLISKLKGSSISDLNTTNKTVIGAIKEVNTPTFTTATSRTNINSGESQSIIMGKIKKWLADLGTAAFCSVVNNLTTTAEGSVLDARQGKNLSDALTKLNTLMGSTDISAIGGGTLTGAISELNSKRGITTFDGKDYSKRFCNIYIEKGATKPSSVLVIGYEGVGIAKFASMSAGNYSASFVNIEGTILSTVDYNKVAIDFGDTNRSVTVIHPTAVTISLKAAESK